MQVQIIKQLSVFLYADPPQSIGANDNKKKPVKLPHHKWPANVIEKQSAVFHICVCCLGLPVYIFISCTESQIEVICRLTPLTN